MTAGPAESGMSQSAEQLCVRVAWLYFMEGLTQGEIAERLGITRLRVNRLVSEARTSGLVGITLNSPLQTCVALEQRLARHFSLQAAVIVPTPADQALVPAVLGRAAGEFLSRHLETHTVAGLGMGWGATLRETVCHVRAARYPGLLVTSMMGGLTHGLELNTFEIASALAKQLGAQCQYLAAPIYAGSPQSRDTILDQDVFREALERIVANDIALLSIGDLTSRSLLVRYGLPRDVTTEELRARGAVGDVMGQFFDRMGKPIDHPLNRRAIALPIDDLRRIPTVVLVAGGAHKIAAIAAALSARLATVLISDEDTAAAALAES